jgi:nitrogen fixation-related uncharacterized protein
MTLLIISIPFMILGFAIALAPVLWAMTHQSEWEAAEAQSVLASDREPEASEVEATQAA